MRLRQMISRLRARRLGAKEPNAEGRPERTPVPLVLYTRPGCHLCDVMKDQIEEARLARPFELMEVDIETDPALEQRYGRSIPVLEIAGRAAFKGCMEVADFEVKFERRAAAFFAATDRASS